MNKLTYLSFLIMTLCGLVVTSVQARDFVGYTGPQPTPNTGNGDNFRAACIESKAEIDLDINNVRARLRAGGDMWWDGNNNARYIVPNVDPASGEPEVSSLFAGAIWLGAYDEGNNLVVAAQTYRSGGNDYWNGPLNEAGTIEKSDCEKWDRHFQVFGADIDALRADFLAPDPVTGESDKTIDVKPAKSILSWPARGNPYFAENVGFELPDQDLAPFIDYDEDGIYDPYAGDHPVIEVVGCTPNYNTPVYADEMIWWVYNDNGNIHTQTNSALAMQMEIQVTAFGYRTTDAINNMTFYRYKLLNRNATTLYDTYFSLWSDPDLGCFNDDMIGCDTVTGMGYVYNADNDDNATCGSGGAVGYGSDQIPALGVDYFRGPLDSAGNQIGLSSFQYHVNGGTEPNIQDPSNAPGYYNLISGFWPNSTPTNPLPVTYGGNGYNPNDPNAVPTNYVFPSFPDDNSANAWSMCNGGTTGGADFRFLHTSGPFVLKPGATNEMISGVVWVPEIPDYPCPSLKELVEADESAQNLFDDCFRIVEGPTAPYMDIIELENELVLNLSYILGQNNYQLKYQEGPAKIKDFEDSLYRFQGFKIYQVVDANVSVTDLDDLEKARLIFQSDVQDSVDKIVNWSSFDDPDILAVIPEIMVEGENDGIQTTYRVTKDQFTTSGTDKLVNHKPYYFCVIAYGFNQYAAFNPNTGEGQAEPYLQGRKNFNIYTGIPRNNSPEFYGFEINAAYGDGPEITRVDGEGNGGGNFLRVKDQTTIETEVLQNGKADRITYASGVGPVNIKIVDPLRVAPGVFKLYISDESYTWNQQQVGEAIAWTPAAPTGITALGDSVYWSLIQSDDPTQYWTSYQTIDFKNEHYIPELGISLLIEQIPTPGVNGNGITGYIGTSIEYEDSLNAVRWYDAIEESDGNNALKTGNAQDDAQYDPNREYESSVGGWYPFFLTDCVFRPDEFYFSPAPIGGSYCNFPSAGQNWRSTPGRILGNQRNVNIVITPDQSKWSRCIVVETANSYHSSSLGLTVPTGLDQFDWKRNSPSVGKDGLVDGTGNGMSWFPGFAYDVETGERLNLFFGENSVFDGNFFSEEQFPGSSTGNDMIYNPTDRVFVEDPVFFNGGLNANLFLSTVAGGHHYIYVSSTPYDECQSLIATYSDPIPPGHDENYSFITNLGAIWTSMSLMAEGTSMDGEMKNIPPSELTVRLRVKTPYEIFTATNENQGYPLYEFNMADFVPTKEDADLANNALDLLNIVPNPYYAYSDYEVTETDNVVKITNVPPKCEIKIFSIDGRFVKRYDIAQEYNTTVPNGISRTGAFGSSNVEDQIATSVDWDLKNSAGVPVGSGVYLVHVIAKDQEGNPYAERVLKSFVINRAFDPQKL
ncbi:MAG: hypothetical protein MK212_00835 [Saprospiraceae bacterium]|nr:hypothetical protein [Saprospiraceae bacterium]